MRSLQQRLARLEAANARTEFWLDLGDGHVTCGRTGERLTADAFRLRFGRPFTFTFSVENARANYAE